MSTMSTAHAVDNLTQTAGYPPTVEAAATGPTEAVLRNVSWRTFVELTDDETNASHRIWYDRGTLTVMPPSYLHERRISNLGRLVTEYCLLRDLACDVVGSMTWRREDLGRGFEGDDAFYLGDLAELPTTRELDPSTDPPPTLVIESEHSRSAIDKLDLLAACGVPEVWRFNGKRLAVHRLDEGGYVEMDHSEALPDFPIATAVDLIAGSATTIQMIRRFREAVQTT